MSTMHYFVVSCIGHLENISSLNYTDLPNVDIFIPKYQKIPLIKYYCWFFVKRAFKFGKLSVENVGCKFSKVQSFTWKLNILAINTASCFLEVIGSLFFILKKMAANTQVSVTVVCHQSFFQVNDVSLKKKKKSSEHGSSFKHLHKTLFQGQHHCKTGEMLYESFPRGHTTWRRCPQR